MAVSGKGGVGKTLVAGGLACFFAGKGLQTIAIDADPSPNLALTLGLSPEKAREIVPVSENSELVSAKTETEFPGVYRLSFTVDDIVKELSIKTPCDVNLIVMGTVRSMGSGCTCPANAVIRALLGHLIVERDEVVILDMEAGVEHFGRGVETSIDNVLIVVEPPLESINVSQKIHDLASGIGIRNVWAIMNRVPSEEIANRMKAELEKRHMEVVGYIYFDADIFGSSLEGKIPVNGVAVQEMKDIFDRILSRAGMPPG